MVDLVKLTIKAGNGGDGRISFFSNRRTLKGGPDGGDGGNGGSVIAVATPHENTLRDYAGISVIDAQNGHMGGAQNMHGKDAEDVTVKLPIGTRIWKVLSSYHPNEPKRMYKNDKDLGRVERSIERRASNAIEAREGVWELVDTPGFSENVTERKTLQVGGESIEVALVGDLTTENQEIQIARGGRGGRGNETFKSSRNTTPMEAQTGEGGEWGEFIFELQLLADVGLVGFPNAGKSTLLSILTKATPKIANYPFTTLEPNLGVMTIDAARKEDRRTLVIADIPGLIEGASEGKGLGHEFLRHVSRCKVLAFLLSLDDGILLDETISPEEIAKLYSENYHILENELIVYEKEATNSSIPFAQKKKLVVLSKADLLPEDRRHAIQDILKKDFPGIFWISSLSREGMDQFAKEVLARL